MTAFPTAGYISNAGRTVAEEKQALEDFLAATKQLPGGLPATTLTISSGQITPTSWVHTVDTEGGAASDDLTNIVQTNLPDGSILFLGSAAAARVVTLKHAAGGSGQILLTGGADYALSSGVLARNIFLFRSGTNWSEVDRSYAADAVAHRAFYGTPGFGQNTWTGRQEEKKGANIASGATLTLGTDGNFFHVTGTTTVTAISTAPAGTQITLCFDGSLMLTHNATSLILPGGSNIQTTAGMTLNFRSEGSGNWRLVAGASDAATVLDRVTANVTVSNTISQTALYSFSVPGGTLGTNRRLRLTLQVSLADNTGGLTTDGIEFQLFYGATLVGRMKVMTRVSDGAGAAPIGVGPFGYILTGLVSADGATNAQIGTCGWQGPNRVALGQPEILGAPIFNGTFTARGTATEDSTIAKSIGVNVIWDSAAASKTVIMEHAVLVRE